MLYECFEMNVKVEQHSLSIKIAEDPGDLIFWHTDIDEWSRTEKCKYVFRQNFSRLKE